jgi:hypothetical protein
MNAEKEVPMIHHHMHRALVLSAGLLMATLAGAEPPNAGAPGKANAASQDQNPAGKPKNLDGKGKGDVKPDPAAPGAKAADTKKDDSDQKITDHAARVKAQHEAERKKLEGILHGPMDDSMREEIRRHARRVARLERIKALATDAKDKDTVDRASKLLGKEDARHEKWMTHAAATAQATTPDPKAGAQ